MTGYTKLFSSIIHSTIWRENDSTRIVWITMLAIKDMLGRVHASIPGLADAARVSIPNCEKALAILEAPDPYSRSKENDGRRIRPIPGGWLVLNHAKYRDARDMDNAREYKKQWDRDHRNSRPNSRYRKGQQKLQFTPDITPDAPELSPPNTPDYPRHTPDNASKSRVRTASSSASNKNYPRTHTDTDTDKDKHSTSAVGGNGVLSRKLDLRKVSDSVLFISRKEELKRLEVAIRKIDDEEFKSSKQKADLLAFRAKRKELIAQLGYAV